MKKSTREEKLDRLRDISREHVAGGFDSFDEILKVVSEIAADDLHEEAVEGLDNLAYQFVHEAWEQHFLEQSSWPTTTDCDRLDVAFGELNRAGVVARQHFSCCGTCAAAEIRNVMGELAAQGASVRGYTSYDVQSTESAARGYGIALNYGASEDGEAAALRIGHEVVDALSRHGLTTDWNGTWEKRITVQLDWKRRRERVALG
jgi:hypothetical protein